MGLFEQIGAVGDNLHANGEIYIRKIPQVRGQMFLLINA
jgi:hypothetical protein